MTTDATVDHAPAPPRLFRAMRHRNYRLYFTGHLISVLGVWLSKVAMSWLVYQLSIGGGAARAATMLGVVNFVAQLPIFVFSPVCGVLVDRFNRRYVLIVTQVLGMLISGTLAVLTLGGWITIWQVIALALIQGMVDALDTPTRQSIIVQLVDDPVDLANAIALNSSCFNAARLIGPAVGGLLLVKYSAGVCFAFNSISYVGVITGLLLMRLVHSRRPQGAMDVLAELVEGVRYTFGFAPLRSILILVGTTAFTTTAFGTLMPLFAAEMKTGPHDAATFGFLIAAIGSGALGGAIYLASRRSVVGLGRVMCLAALLLGLATSAFALTHSFYLGLVLCAAAGFGMVTHFASGNTMLQSITEDAMRGRVMSFFTVAVIGMAPFGSLLAGWLSAKFHHPTPVVLIYATIMIASALLFLRKLPELRKLVRPIYVKKGIIPEVAVALAMEEREER